jgi:hypothetical protein
VEPLISSRLVRLQGRLARPFWGGAGLWAALCGALASGGLRWDGDALWTLALVLLLAELGWGSLWDLVTNGRWLRGLGQGWPPQQPVAIPRLPYTLPDSPAGRLLHRMGRLAAWWRETGWPAAGGALLGSVAAAVLVVALSLLLPDAMRLLNAALLALVGLGLWQRGRGREPLLGGALAQVGLGWLAGHVVFAPMAGPPLLLALSFSLAVWGAMRLKEGRRGALWLLDGGQVAVVAVLAALKQPLAAFAVGLLLLGQVALQPGLAAAEDRERALRRTWPWLMAAMLVAALAIR